jgi:hypothetical protein
MSQFEVCLLIIVLVSLWTLQQIKSGLSRIGDILSDIANEDDEVKED